MNGKELSGKEVDESTENKTEFHTVVIDGDEEATCDRCGSLNNVFWGFVHDVADESWTDYDALCRECFIVVAPAGDDEEVRR